MSGCALSSEEIYELKKGEFEERKKAVLKEIEELGILDIDIIGGELNLEVLEIAIKVVKRDQERMRERLKNAV